jgi:hypothetical protein
MHWMAEINRRTVGPVTFGSRRATRAPSCFRKILELVDERGALGGELRPQTTARGIGCFFGLQHRTFFDRAPEWPRSQPSARRAPRRARRSVRRAELLRAGRENTPPLDWAGVYVLAPGRRLLRRPGDLAGGARRAGAARRSPRRSCGSRETRGRALFNYPFLNQRHGRSGGDARPPAHGDRPRRLGAHVGLIMDARCPTWFLSHWVRDRKKYEIEDAIRRLTSDTAELFGVTDAACSEPGAFADVNVLDLDALACELPEVVHDFPPAPPRYIQRAQGYPRHDRERAVFVETGSPTGAHAGRTLRS